MLNRTLIMLIVISSIFIIAMDTANAEENSTLIIYDTNRNFGYVEDVVLSVKEMLYHYTSEIEVVLLEDYTTNGIQDYEYAIIIGLESSSDFSQVVMDSMNYEGKVFWIGEGIEQLINLDDLGFEIGENIFSYRNVEYKSYTGSLGIKRDFKRINIRDEKIEVLASLNNNLEKNPFIINVDKLWYMSKIEITSKLLFVFADVLNDFYELKEFDEESIYIRLEDIHAYTDTKKLREIGEYLYKENIPFMMALIPVYKSDKYKDLVRMNEVPEFVETIKYLTTIGGSVVLHGYTHQYTGESSGEGYEFWNGIDNRPLDVDMAQWVGERIPKALDECVSNRIYPLLFEVPHYAISQDGYYEVGKYFSTIIGHFQNSDLGFATTVYPFELYDTNYGVSIVPENLGYFDPSNPLTLEALRENMEVLDIVRGGLGGFFYHPYLGIENLKECIEIIKSYDVSFFDITEENHSVNWKNNSIELIDGMYIVNFVEEESVIGIAETVISDSITYLILFLAIVIFIQLWILIIFRKKHKKRLDQ